MNKKGFTLVELLAVIAILALLVIIALPNVLSMFNNAKKDLFLTEAKNVFKESAKKYISDNMHNSNEGNIYCKSETDSKNPLDMDIGNTYYYIEKDSTGKTIKFVAWNSSGYVTKVVGDNVIVDVNTKTIEKVELRKNYLERPLIANIDKLLIVMSTSIPAFSSYLIDKFLLIAYKNEIEPIIVITKTDMITMKEKSEIKKYINYYRKLKIKI